jgi:hypothetical protein
MMTEQMRKRAEMMNLVRPNLRMHIGKEGFRPAAAADFCSSSHNRSKRSALCWA